MSIKYGRPMPGNSVSLTDETLDKVDNTDINVTDIWVEESTAVGWVDLDQTGLDVVKIPFNGLHTRIQNTAGTSPKVLLLHLNRTAGSHQVGMGANTGDFSNVKITLLGSGHTSRTLVDESTDNTKYTSRNYEFEPQLYNAIMIEFYTTDTVTLSNVTIQKSTSVTAQIKAAKTDGSLVNVGASESGNLKITDAESGLAIAKGEVTGSSFIHKFGHAQDFDISDGLVTIWDGAEDGEPYELMRYVYSTTAAIDSISGDNASDTQVIEVQGLDANWDLVVQEVTLNGQNRVALGTPLIRIFRAKNVGSVDLLGHVLVYENTAISGGVPIDTTKVRAVIHAENNQTEMAVFTIPAGKTGYMRDWYASMAGTRKAATHEIKLYARPFGQVFQLKHNNRTTIFRQQLLQHSYVEPEVFREKTDVEMRVNTDQDSAGVAGGFDIVLIDN